MLATLIAVVGLQQTVRPLTPEPASVQKKKLHAPVQGAPAEMKARALADRRANQADSIFRNVPWRCVGPTSQGARIVNLAVPSRKPETLFIGYATSGLWRTENDGRTATPIFDDQGAYGIGDFTVSDDGQSLWVGTGEHNSQRTSYAGNGVYHSADGGKTWQYKGLAESHHIGKILVNPQNPNEVYVGVLGHLYSQNPERGVFKSTDGGATWQHVLKLDDWTGVVDMAMDPKDPKKLWACAWERDRRAWDILESGPGSAIYKSTDGGKSWQKDIWLPSGEALGRPSIAISPSNPNRIYVFIDNHGPDDAEKDERIPGGRLTLQRFRNLTAQAFKALPEDVLTEFIRRYAGSSLKEKDLAQQVRSGTLSQQGLVDAIRTKRPDFFRVGKKQAEVYRSDDGGRNWKLTRPTMGDHGGYYWTRVFVHPTNPDELYTTGTVLLKSTDAGRSWTRVAETEHVDFHAVAFDPSNPRRMFAGQDGGLSVSYDGGATWATENHIQVGQFTTLALDNKRPYNIIGGLQDNGTMRGPSNFRPGRDDADKWKSINGGDGSAIAVDPRGDGDVVYTAYQFGAFTRQDLAKGLRSGINVAPHPGTTNRFNWIAPIALSPFHPDVVFVGTQRVYRSFDQGATFTEISPDLTKAQPGGNVPWGTLTAIAPSPFRFEKLFAGADDGSIHVTKDGGANWTAIPTPSPDRWVTRIVASRHVDGRVYVTQNGYRQDDWTALVWRSDDDGKSWRSIAAGLPSESVNTIREDPAYPNVLYVGTDMGVYVSLDGGASWSAFGRGMPDTPVHDIQVHERDREIVAASHARTVYVASLEWVKQALDRKVTSLPLAFLNLNDKGGRDTWPYEAVPPYSSDLPSPKTVDFQVWSDRAGDAEITLVGKDGEVKREKLHLDHGFNWVSFNLLLKAGVKFPNPDPVKDPIDPAAALRDPFAGSRPVYPPVGDYTLVITRGGAKAEGKFSIRGGGGEPASPSFGSEDREVG